MLLNGCTLGQKSKEVKIIKTGCPAVTPCYLPMNNLRRNRSLIDDNQAILTAWHQCAIQVEMIYQCQQEQNQHGKN
ncbi:MULTISPECIES: Rz1-like lysis system protein LysC [unclassified Gilliamella]|uniref:Rz1-like lysis system protein LysC n=1 Tax=unclassified Gilliamella TaxID=2685620 RepID=UPI001C400A3A|nr:Rz1-like lysis system protein LysC [Gilliamella apicola]